MKSSPLESVAALRLKREVKHTHTQVFVIELYCVRREDELPMAALLWGDGLGETGGGVRGWEGGKVPTLH